MRLRGLMVRMEISRLDLASNVRFRPRLCEKAAAVGKTPAPGLGQIEQLFCPRHAMCSIERLSSELCREVAGWTPRTGVGAEVRAFSF